MQATPKESANQDELTRSVDLHISTLFAVCTALDCEVGELLVTAES